jgi:hypothetical protein
MDMTWHNKQWHMESSETKMLQLNYNQVSRLEVLVDHIESVGKFGLVQHGTYMGHVSH